MNCPTTGLTTPAIDYAALLKKYMQHVAHNEGVDFVHAQYRAVSSKERTQGGPELMFSTREWAELQRLSDENIHEEQARWQQAAQRAEDALAPRN